MYYRKHNYTVTLEGFIPIAFYMQSQHSNPWRKLQNLHHINPKLKTKLRGFLVRKRTITTERPQPAGEVSANFSW
jgi:hypothetical protein